MATITIAAASSLSTVLPLLVARFRQEAGNAISVRTSFGASGTIVQQIIAGAPIDVFLSAGIQEVKTLQTRQNSPGEGFGFIFAQNRLVLAQTKNSSPIRSFTDLQKIPAGFRIAIGKPETVPAGRYAKETLVKRALWDSLTKDRRLIFTGTVRQASDAVAVGNVQAAFIFATDAHANPKLKISFAAVPGKDHEPIQYVAIVCPGSKNSSDAARFLEFLKGKSAQQLLRSAGFLSV